MQEREESKLFPNWSFFAKAAGVISLLLYLEDKGEVPAGWRGKRVVELGCGAGAGLWAFKCLGANPVGVDIQKYFLSEYKRHPMLRTLGLEYYEQGARDFLQGQSSNSLDAICAFNTESDVWVEQVVREAERTLKRNGLVVITWQHVNLSTPDTNWPGEWPIWNGTRRIIELRPERTDRLEESYVQPFFVDPKDLVKGRITISKGLECGDVFLPEYRAMVGYNRQTLHTLGVLS